MMTDAVMEDAEVFEDANVMEDAEMEDVNGVSAPKPALAKEVQVNDVQVNDVLMNDVRTTIAFAQWGMCFDFNNIAMEYLRCGSFKEGRKLIVALLTKAVRVCIKQQKATGGHMFMVAVCKPQHVKNSHLRMEDLAEQVIIEVSATTKTHINLITTHVVNDYMRAKLEKYNRVNSAYQNGSPVAWRNFADIFRDVDALARAVNSGKRLRLEDHLVDHVKAMRARDDIAVMLFDFLWMSFDNYQKVERDMVLGYLQLPEMTNDMMDVRLDVSVYGPDVYAPSSDFFVDLFDRGDGSPLSIDLVTIDGKDAAVPLYKQRKPEEVSAMHREQRAVRRELVPAC